MNKKIFSKSCNLSSYTTIKVGGVAEYFAEPRSIEEFSYLIEGANLNKQRCQIIGAGSNLLINNIFIKIFFIHKLVIYFNYFFHLKLTRNYDNHQLPYSKLNLLFELICKNSLLLHNNYL